MCARRALVAGLTRAHDDVLADCLPENIALDAELVAELLGLPEAEAVRLLDELEAAGDIVSATGPVQ